MSFDPELFDPTVGAFEYSLGGHMYDMQLFIYNDRDIIYPIAPTAIVALTLDECLDNWVAQGTLTIFYTNELDENASNHFNFRNNGEDLLRLRMVPRDITLGGLPSLGVKDNKKLWEINRLYSIYSIDDVTPPKKGRSLKSFKKFSFWDLRYQIMITKNQEYSTGLSDTLINPNDYSDKGRSINTSTAIEEIIKQSLFDGNKNIINKTGKDSKEPEKEWEEGASDIFYTSGAQSNAYEDLMYVYGRHASSKTLGINNDTPRDYSILTIEREDDGLGYFSLKPLSKYFENAGRESPGEYQIEHFFLQNELTKETTVGLYRSPVLPAGDRRKDRDLNFRDYSTITSYEFVDIDPLVNAAAFATTPVHSFDFKNRQFNIEFKNNGLESAQEIFKSQYIFNLYKDRSSQDDAFLIKNVTKSKKQGVNYTVNPVFSLYGDSDKPEIRNSDGLHRLLYTGLFQNTCINFNVPGLTIREAGRFIAIDRLKGSDDSTFDDTLCGQWFVINVLHTISNGEYINNITAVKIHRYKPPEFELDLYTSEKNISNQRGRIGEQTDSSKPYTPPNFAAGTFVPGLNNTP